MSPPLVRYPKRKKAQKRGRMSSTRGRECRAVHDAAFRRKSHLI